ncbi:MAG: TlpA family protein disulfide reductase [Clostridia bacterium]|nr:TlpA family protein disulfide reductase [Clostridia bacterium]
MKRFFLAFLLLALTLVLLTACENKDDLPAETTAAEDGTLNFSSFTAYDLDGNSVSGDIFAGHKLTMLNVWGTYCGPCLREMPDLARLATAYGEDFQLIGIVIDAARMNAAKNFVQRSDKIEEAKDIIAQTGAHYLHLLPSESLADLFLNEVQVIPTTLFLDGDGNVVGQYYYGSRSFEDWKSVIDAHLEALS